MNRAKSGVSVLRWRRDSAEGFELRIRVAQKNAREKHGSLIGATMHRLDHAAKPLSTCNLFEKNRLPFGHGRLVTRRPVVSVRMWAGLVVVLREFANQIIEVILAEGDKVIEAFGLDCLNETFDLCVQIG